MDRRIATVLAVASTSAGLVIALTVPAFANTPGGAGQRDAVPAVGANAEAVPPDVLAALQRDLRLSPEQVRVRLAKEAAAGRADLKLRKSLGAAYAGTWLTADAGTFIVATTSSTHADLVRSVGAEPRVVSRSEAQLDTVKSTLDSSARSAPRSVAGWYVDVTTNSVVVLGRDGSAATTFVSGSGADPAAVRFVPTVENPSPLYDVRGADAFYIGGGRCSIGFSVNGGFVTAGHCGENGDAVQGFNQVSMGTFRGSSFPGNDYSWVQVNSNWTPRGVVNNYSGGTVSVAGSQESATGASICRSGSTTGWHCGTVQAKNATVNYAEGTVTGLTRTNVCAEPGDSGGSWLSGTQAQGVTSGGSGDCDSGGTTYFQPVNEILSAYGLTLVTGGGGGTTPPPPTGCGAYESRYTGTLSSGAGQYQPSSAGFFVAASGAHQVCLDGPSGTDFDLYLQKRSGSSWVTVASATSENPDETLTYSGTAGYYRYRALAYSGSGSYVLGANAP